MKDFHKERAAQMFQVPYDKVTDAQRKEAKRLSFFQNYQQPRGPQKCSTPSR